MNIRIATVDDAGILMPFVRAYHEFEGIQSTEPERARSVAPLLSDNGIGRIWIILERGQAVGYIALCFGYSIEFGGRDAFLDEFFVIPSARSRGLGSMALEAVKAEMTRLGVRAMHLEVARNNLGAKEFYSRAGFESREQFHLMSCRLDGR
jgi:ribosomal protein S18 acetylase RimI-like enzyme